MSLPRSGALSWWGGEFNHQLINLEWLSYQIPFLNSHAVSLLKILVRDEESTKAEVDVEVGKEWRGRPLLNESGARGRGRTGSHLTGHLK